MLEQNMLEQKRSEQGVALLLGTHAIYPSVGTLTMLEALLTKQKEVDKEAIQELLTKNKSKVKGGTAKAGEMVNIGTIISTIRRYLVK